MKTIYKVFAILLILTLGTIGNKVQAQDSGWKSGNSLSVGFPVGNMEIYSHSIGIYGNIDYNFNKFLAARFDLGWNDFSGPKRTWIDQSGNTHTDHPNMSVWEFTAGLRAKVSVFYIEGRGGYFTGVNRWGVTPAVGIRLGKFDIQANFNIAQEYHWGGIRLAYYYGG